MMFHGRKPLQYSVHTKRVGLHEVKMIDTHTDSTNYVCTLTR